MPRKPRIEFAGATYHITARGNRGEDIIFDQKDSLFFLDLLGEVCELDRWTCYAFCLMPNHYHLLVQTNEPTLSKGMQRLNSRYASFASKAHDLGGHLLQGRFQAVLVDKESYLKDLVRYIALNPVRAGLAGQPEQWRWGSYRTLALGEVDQAAKWFDVVPTLDWLGDVPDATGTWRKFVESGLTTDRAKVDLIETQLNNNSALGGKAFIEDLRARGFKMGRLASAAQEPIETYAARAKFRGQAMADAYLKGGHRQIDIARFFEVDGSTVSKAIARFR